MTYTFGRWPVGGTRAAPADGFEIEIEARAISSGCTGAKHTVNVHLHLGRLEKGKI